ncbi:MAG: ATP-binding cassette domain-containing protein, partial [Acidobacteria bacterium]|nr:ATP-binding cassette domain-containing protein [Acidobacteriota bacterium]
MSDALLAAAGISRSFQSGPRRIEVLSRLDLEIVSGESVAIVGESGVGKSTLLHLLGGLDRPDTG